MQHMASSSLVSSVSQLWSQRLQASILFLFHLLLMTVPFFFTWVNEELFEFNKLILTYALTVGIVGLWLARMVVEKKVLLKRTPFDIPLLLFLGSQVLSTIFSIDPRTSVFGYYTRFHGGLLSLLTYTTLFYVFVSTVERRHLRPLLLTVLISGLGVSAYAIPEHFGASPSCYLISGGTNVGVNCWVQKVQERVFGTFGQPNWLAAYTVMLLPVSVIAVSYFQSKTASISSRLKNPKVWLSGIASVALFCTLLFTKSRSGLLGFVTAFGLLISLLILNKATQKRNINDSKIIISSTLFFLLFVILGIAFGTPFSPSVSQFISRPSSASVPTNTETAPVTNQLENGGTESGEIRKIVWTGAIDIWRRYPIFGSGVETFAYSYYQDRPAAHNVVSEWDFLYNKAHNEFLNYLATTGLVGFLTYTGLLLWFGVWSLRQILTPAHQLDETQKAWLAALLSGVAGLSVSNFFGFSTVMVTILMFLFLATASVVGSKLEWVTPPLLLAITYKKWQKPWLSKGLLVGIGLLSLWSLVMISNWWLADYDYARGKSLLGAGQTSTGLDRLQTASRRMPHEALFWDELSITYAQLAVAYQDENEPEAVEQLTQAAELASDQTLVLNDRHLNFYKNRARVFIVLAALNPEYLNQAEATLQAAKTLAPTDAKLLYNLALVQAALGKNAEAITTLQQTVTLKPNYEEAHLELGAQLLQAGELTAAQQEYVYVLQKISGDNPTALAQLKVIEASLSAQRQK